MRELHRERQRNPLLDHMWGVSSAEDRVWAQISGMAPSAEPWERLFVVLQIYIDESYSNRTNRRVYVVAGYVATAEAWAAFSKEWEALLPQARRGNSGRFRFKMAEMSHHMDRVPAFYDVIRRHALVAVSLAIHEDDLERAKARIWSDNTEIIFSPADDAPHLIKRMLIQHFYKILDDPSILYGSGHRVQDALISNRAKVDFYFDDDSGSTWISDWWEDFSATKKEDPSIYGSPPRFEDDEIFLPLQAADFWAWWVRWSYETNARQELLEGKFGSWQAKDTLPMVFMDVTEDLLAEHFVGLLQAGSPIRSMINIYDANKKPRNEHALPVRRAQSRSAMLSHMERILRRLRRR